MTKWGKGLGRLVVYFRPSNCKQTKFRESYFSIYMYVTYFMFSK
jgi:hypothetical protein